jgi:hypothetical protein
MSHFLSLDIETGGINKPIFALGAVVFVVNEDKTYTILDEIIVNFSIPESYDDAYYTKETWDTFWGPTHRPWNVAPNSAPVPNPNFKVLQTMNAAANCKDESELISKFYTWWYGVTQKYADIRIVTDSPTFDVGYTDLKINQYKPMGEKSLPLVHQWKSCDTHRYVSTLDYNTFELLFEMTFGNDAYDRLNELIGKTEYMHDHNPLNDAKHQAVQFARLFPFMKTLLMNHLS